MKVQEVELGILDRLNKLGTNFNQRIPKHTIVRKVNEAVSYWFEERLKTQELTRTIQRELDKFIITEELVRLDSTDTYVNFKKPTLFYHISNLNVIGKKDCSHSLMAFLIEQANENTYMNDENIRPSFEFEQTLYTLENDKIKIYRTDFEIDSANLSYYREPKKIDIKGEPHYDNTPSVDIDLELDGSSAYEILNIAAKLIAGDIQSPNYQIQDKHSQEYK